MNQLLIGLLICMIIIMLILVFVIFKVVKQNMEIEKNFTQQTLQQVTALNNIEKQMQKDLYDFNFKIEKSMNVEFRQVLDSMDKRLVYMQQQMDQKLDKTFQQTNQTFTSIVERLNIIDQAQKKIDSLSTNIVSLQDILNDKKARGAFGEIQLVNIFKTVFGNNDRLYKVQYTLSNHTKIDLALFAPEPMGLVGIDSKFPLENYQKMLQANGAEAKLHERQFKQDVKKHIDDIAKKYIIPGETAEYAILFLPAEAIFAYINAYAQDVVEYSYQQKVWITSPTTLMALLSTLQVTLQNMERDKYAEIIKEELMILSKEFTRYQDRWSALAKHIDQVSRDVKEVNITSHKIATRFSKIDSVEFIGTQHEEIDYEQD